MINKPVEIKTADGVADGIAIYPSEEGSFPGVIFYMDAIGIRPALIGLAEKLAEQGYYVFIPNLFYRHGKAPVLDYAGLLSGENSDEIRGQMMTMIRAINPEQVRADAGAYLDFLAAQPQVQAGKVATTGYCMGGAYSLRTAGYYPDRVVAAASLHGGNLATDQPESPHLLADSITAELYIGHAKEDHSAPPEQIERLEAALTGAGVVHQSEMYDAHHGWTMPDVSVYNEAEAERAWRNLIALLERSFVKNR